MSDSTDQYERSRKALAEAEAQLIGDHIASEGELIVRLSVFLDKRHPRTLVKAQAILNADGTYTLGPSVE